MLSLLKRKSEAAAGPAVPAWHPNFRDYEKLPDVKVVRTAFFVNGAAVLIVVSLAIYFGIHEWQLRAVRGQVAAAQAQIDRDKKPSDQAVALFKKFQSEGATVADVDKFVKSRPTLSPIILRITQTLPENVAVDSIELRPVGMVLRLTVRGSPEAAAGYATAYFNQLKSDAELTAFDRSKLEFTNQARNPTTGRLAVEFLLRYSAQYAEKRP